MNDETVLRPTSQTQASYRLCPICGGSNELGQLIRGAYNCSHCQKEIAHIDYAQNGAIRGIFGWLLSPGDVVFSRYQIKSVLGKGGFGAAYLVDDLELSGKHRALKEIPVQMFDEYETALLSRLDHPAIPDIIDRRIIDGMCYLVLKFGGSSTLASERKNYPGNQIPLAKLLPWMQQLCEVLTYLHEQNPPIIHRDLKPGNILLDESERIMLIDFGIAKEVVGEDMTRTLGRAASLHFSPPEQVMGTGTDARADIFALGATFYALLTGCNPPPVHERVAGKELKAPSQFVNNLPPAIEDAILRALELNMNHRQQTIREFAQALSVLGDADLTHPPRQNDYAERTVLGNAAPQAGNVPSRSIKFSNDGIAVSQEPLSVRTGNAASRQTRNVVMALGALALVLAAASSWFILQQSKDAPEPPAEPVALTEQPAPVSPPLPEPEPEPKPVPAETAETLLQPQPQSASVEPAAPVPAPSTDAQSPPPPADAINAPITAEEAVKPAAPAEPPPAPKRVAKIPPKPAAKPKAAKVAREEIRSAPQQSWVIIPGGTQKTD
ncbi:serine/threonine protein kinase [Methylomonas sp. SURF-2]|uniref:non-specific serine/threonine protein kinase n=1 Tax=Methylomonas subterranea TaxID=2952225 RepID=A0ABT1THM6_9GAMM|nr:serine/threonine-protein kinase [Methylomonas sp. SURF-2]MCQ8104763.1 serine/threonine protein kinase [Methylomonas sp. SURF-2]